jgi:hypothetical protein
VPAADDAFTNALSNAAGGLSGDAEAAAQEGRRYRLEVAPLRESATTPGEYEPDPFRDPFAAGGDVGTLDGALDGAAGAFDSEHDALDAWADALAAEGLSAQLAEGPPPPCVIRHQQRGAPCYRLTDRHGRAVAHVLVRVDRADRIHRAQRGEP